MELPPCELCLLPASVRCPSDDASLCWRCDSIVHSANFLVARHSRALLCSSCSSPTDCLVTGPSVQPKVPFCSHCFVGAASAAGFDRDDEESKIAASECVSGEESESTGTSRRRRVATNIAGSAACDCVMSARSRGREKGEGRCCVKKGRDTNSDEFCKEGTTGESSCESNTVRWCATAAKRHRRSSDEEVGDSEDRVCGTASSSSSQLDGSVCGFLQHKRMRMDNSVQKQWTKSFSESDDAKEVGNCFPSEPRSH